MPRTVKVVNLETPTARMRLKPGRNAYWRAVVPGKVHLGYARAHTGRAGRWMVRIYSGKERYRVATLGQADDYGEGLTFAEAHAAAAARGGRPVGPLTVKGATDIYLEAQDRAGKPTGDSRSRITRQILPSLGNTRVEELTTEQLQKWLADLTTAPLRRRKAKADDPEAVRRRRSTANRTLSILKAALNYAFDAQLVSSNIAWGRRLKPFRKVDAARVRYLRVAEAKRLINSADRDTGFRDLVHAALLTGCRYSELARLTVADFDPDAGTVAVRQSKSGRPRQVFLTSEGTKFFEGLAAGRAGDAPLLPCHLPRRARDGAAPDMWLSSDQIRPMVEAVKRAKISPPINFHGLRHTYASLSVMAGVPLQVVARNLGHVDTRMVEKHYGHLEDSFMRNAIRDGAPRFGAVKRSNVRALR